MRAACSWQASCQCPAREDHLHYISTERPRDGCCSIVARETSRSYATHKTCIACTLATDNAMVNSHNPPQDQVLSCQHSPLKKENYRKIEVVELAKATSSRESSLDVERHATRPTRSTCVRETTSINTTRCPCNQTEISIMNKGASGTPRVSFEKNFGRVSSLSDV